MPFKSHRYWLILGCILLFAFATSIYKVSTPPEYIFDEVYHALTAKLISRNDPRAYEWWHPAIEPGTAIDWLHPPLAKYTQAVGMLLFGENSFGWRISSVIFGVLVIAATALLADELFENKNLSLLAAFLASLDGLLLVQSRIAMNDIHVTFFILLTFLFYIRYRKKPFALRLFWTGVAAGLAMGSKWSGVFALGTVWGFEVLDLFTRKIHFAPKTILQHFLLLLFLPATLYVLSYTLMFLQGKSLICEGDHVEEGQCYCVQDSSQWVDILKTVAPQNTAEWEKLEARGGCKRLVSHFSELHYQIWWYQTNLKATHPYQSRPYQWFLDLRPVWYSVETKDDQIANIYAFGNPLLFWFGDIAVFVTLGYFAQQLLTKKFPFKKFQPLFFLLVAYFAVWLPWQASPRIMFFYHYTPAVPLLCCILAYWLMMLEKKQRILAIGIVAAIVITFVVFYPNWTHIFVPKTFADKVYFAMSSWR